MLRLPEHFSPKILELRVGGREVGATLAVSGTRASMALASEVIVEAGDRMEVTLS